MPSILPSQLTLLASSTLYPLLFRRLTGPNATRTRYDASLKTISTLHSLVTTLLAIYALRQQQRTHVREKAYPDDTSNPLISTRSECLNAITALETGYLVSDTFALLLCPRFPNGKSQALDKVLLTHHTLIGTALLVLQYYIARGREKGIYIIVRFLLMNASTPFLNLRWFLRQYRGQRKELILSADVIFAIAFFWARVSLVWSILAEYGQFHGWSAWEAYQRGLMLPCKLGTGALVLANSGWWIVMVRNLVRRRG